MLTLDRAKELLNTTTTEEHLFLHAKNVSVAMGGLAKHFGEDPQYWSAIGYLHDYDYEQYPEEHLAHTEEPLLAAGVTPEEVRAHHQRYRSYHDHRLIHIDMRKVVPYVPLHHRYLSHHVDGISPLLHR